MKRSKWEKDRLDDMEDEKIPLTGANKVMRYVGLGMILFTGLFNLFCYFKLPEKISTQFTTSGKLGNSMPSYLYLIISFAAIAFFALRVQNKRATSQQRIVSVTVSMVLCVLNFVLIVYQL